VKELLRHADETPVTFVIAVAWVTLACLTGPLSPSSEQLAAYGWLTPLDVAEGGWWRLFSSEFLHGGIVHLLCNLSALVSLGPALERSLGSVRLLVLYAASSLGSGIVVCLACDIGQPVVGGSGALFGMLGALVAMNMRAGRHLLSFLDFEGPRRLLVTIGVYLLIGWLLPFMSNAGHIGGLLGGLIVTFLWLRPGEVTAGLWQWRIATTALAAGALLWCLAPVTRSEYLWNRSIGTEEPARRTALLRAAAMAEFGMASATDDDVPALQRKLFPPTEDPPPKRGG